MKKLLALLPLFACLLNSRVYGQAHGLTFASHEVVADARTLLDVRKNKSVPLIQYTVMKADNPTIIYINTVGFL